MINPLSVSTQGLLSGNSLTIGVLGWLELDAVIAPEIDPTGSGPSSQKRRRENEQRHRINVMRDDHDILMITVAAIEAGIIE
jgi:hypothetical protein